SEREEADGGAVRLQHAIGLDDVPSGPESGKAVVALLVRQRADLRDGGGPRPWASNRHAGTDGYRLASVAPGDPPADLCSTELEAQAHVVDDARPRDLGRERAREIGGGIVGVAAVPGQHVSRRLCGNQPLAGVEPSDRVVPARVRGGGEVPKE